jgi:FlaG/FlaF family flagellin (archaellin)
VDNRAVAPVVGKLLATAIAVLYIAGTTSLLLGGVVPEYRTAVGEELSERTLAEAAATVERAASGSGSTTEAHVRADLPPTIRDGSYRLVLRNGTLVLDHDDPGLDARTRLSMPSKVHTVEGSWSSGQTLVVRATGGETNRTVELVEQP